MNTPAHLIVGVVACGRRGDARVTLAAFLGALVPDVSLYVMTGWSLFVRAVPAKVVFGELYFSERWQSVFAIDNSFPLWTAGLTIALVMQSRLAVAFTGAGLLHLVADFFLHHDDARRMFWPVTNWVFHSPVSYWDPRYHGNIVAPIEVTLSLLLCIVLWRRAATTRGRALVAALALAEALPTLLAAIVPHG
jgi:hypothetical protein